MERVDLEQVRAVYASLSSDGTPDPELFDPGVEWHNAPELPGAAVHHGVEAMMTDIRAQAEAWEERHFEPVDMISTDDGAVVFLEVTARGRSSGTPVHLEVVHVLTLQDGKIVRVRAFIDREQALQAAGVERVTSKPSNLEAIRAEGLKLAPWHLGIEIAPGLTTEDLYRESDRSVPFYEPGPAIKGCFTGMYPDGLDGRSALDCACNNGAHLFALKEIGAGRCFGSDVRQHWIDQARFLAQHRDAPSDDMEFEVADLYELSDRGLAPFDIGVFAGIFYHLPDPIRGLQIVADLTKEVLFFSSVCRADRPDDLLVAGEESTTLPLSGVHQLAFLPTGPKVLTRILRWLGFPAVRCLNWWTPPNGSPYPDSIQLVAAREESLLEGLESKRPDGRAGMLMHIRETVRPRGTILIVRTEHDEPLDVPDREVRDFPERDPWNLELPEPDARTLIAQLDRFWAAGAEYLVVPSDAFPWLDDNPEFKSFLDFRYTAPVRDPASCILYDLGS